jgi:hypothetical protein
MRTYSKRSVNTKVDSSQILSGVADYQSLSIDLTPLPWNCNKIQYCVSQINFTANYYITTSNDYIEIMSWDLDLDPPDYQLSTYYFDNLTEFDQENLTTYLTHHIFRDELNVTKYSNGTISINVIQPRTVLIITDITRRARWFIGYTLPIPSIESFYVYGNQIPSTTFGNLLYLTSLQGETVSTTTEDNTPITPSIIYRINQFMRPGLPVIINKKQTKIISNPISKIDLRLTDCYFEPIILLSPLYVAIEVRPFPHRK